MDLSQFNGALARLDAEISETEERLADLRLKRRGAEAFLAYMEEDTSIRPRRVSIPRRPTSALPTAGPTDVVESIAADASPNQVLTIDYCFSQAQQLGHDFTRDQVKNAMHYLARKDTLISVGRGAWMSRDAETPVEAGVSVGTFRPELEGGDSHETTAATASAAEDHSDLQLGASITEVAR